MSEKVDRVYREYFRQEMPAELPPLRKSELAPPRREYASRFVLAASVLALVGLGVWLPTPTAKDVAVGSSTKLLKGAAADGSKLLEK